MLQPFTKKFLYPRYWLIWTGLVLLWLIVQLPYPVLHILGTGLGKLSRPFMKRREGIAVRNIELCFPEMTPFARSQMVSKSFVSLGMGLMETGMAWFWSDARIKKCVDLITLCLIRRNDKKGYNMYISSVLSDYPEGDEIAAATYINKIIESEILRAPEQYLWMHRRFKTRPKDGGSLYE
ncbi:hypothetical protein SD435_17095 [Kosakonia cowanii]|uniref:LpxL/LpxP family acyltransferase n=1 Tax=Kosakonia cowanii TaxID=208223 RepID=UPI0029C91ACE|nr:hypothetical protein [Kosakonia cowanii]WPG19988.1 hypothetical protein SD435_17095 [Kosakonia cowanii]